MTKKEKDMWKNNKHPRGMLNKHHTEDTKRIISSKNSINQLWDKNSMFGKKRTIGSLRLGIETRRRNGNLERIEETKRKIRIGNKITHNQPKYKMMARIRRSKQIFPVKDTTIEVKIQDFLKQLKIPFFTHQYIKEIKHGYQCDVFIPSMNMVIECDGNYWHKYPTGREIDRIRTSELIGKGFKVLRLWEIDIRQLNIRQFNAILRNKKHE